MVYLFHPSWFIKDCRTVCTSTYSMCTSFSLSCSFTLSSLSPLSFSFLVYGSASPCSPLFFLSLVAPKTPTLPHCYSISLISLSKSSAVCSVIMEHTVISLLYAALCCRKYIQYAAWTGHPSNFLWKYTLCNKRMYFCGDQEHIYREMHML